MMTLGLCAIAITGLLSGCTRAPTTAPAAPGAPGAPGAPECLSPTGTAPISEALTELLKTIESAPLYATLLSITPLRTCRVTEHSARIVLDYTFADGSVLHVERDSRIEYTLQEARFATPVSLDALEVLTRAERTAFGAQGCGIDWLRPEMQAAKENATVRDTVYRGDTCNCQARVRTAASGRVVGLIFRSAC
jgi:hypothetical protein